MLVALNIRAAGHFRRGSGPRHLESCHPIRAQFQHPSAHDAELFRLCISRLESSPSVAAIAITGRYSLHALLIQVLTAYSSFALYWLSRIPHFFRSFSRQLASDAVTR